MADPNSEIENIKYTQNGVYEETKKHVSPNIKTEPSSDGEFFHSESDGEESTTENIHRRNQMFIEIPNVSCTQELHVENVVIKFEPETIIVEEENPITYNIKMDNSDISPIDPICEDFFAKKTNNLSDTQVSVKKIPDENSLKNKRKYKRKADILTETEHEKVRRKSGRTAKTIKNLKFNDKVIETQNEIKEKKERAKKLSEKRKIRENKATGKPKIAKNKKNNNENATVECDLPKTEIPEQEEVILPEPERFECVICGFESETTELHDEHLVQHSPSECKCPFAHCHLFFPDGLILDTHFIVAHGYGKQFACIICGKAFRTELTRDRHVLECATNNINITDKTYVDSNFECNFCKACFDDDFQFKIHLGTHIHEGIYDCKLCMHKFQDQASLDKHLMFHKQFKCEHCNKSYISKRSFNDHIRLKHTDRSLVCSDCKRTFKDNKALIEHMNRHAMTKDFQCSECEKAYSTKHCLKDHIRRKHMAENNGRSPKSSLCEVCKKRIGAGRMERHMMFHTKEKPFQCKFCEKRFADRSKLNRHLRIHYGVKPCICTECATAFRTKAELRIHFIKHITPGDPKYKDVYQTCPVCNKYTGSIQKHMRRYHVKETIICETCGKTFSSKASYSEHVVIHTNGPQHTCEICQRTFARKWNMVSHRERHSNEKYSARYVKKIEIKKVET